MKKMSKCVIYLVEIAGSIKMEYVYRTPKVIGIISPEILRILKRII
jgi:hypothetical protein